MSTDNVKEITIEKIKNINFYNSLTEDKKKTLIDRISRVLNGEELEDMTQEEIGILKAGVDSLNNDFGKTLIK